MATSLNTKRTIIGILSIVFLVVLIFALWKEVQRSMPDYRPAPIVDSETKHCGLPRARIEYSLCKPP